MKDPYRLDEVEKIDDPGAWQLWWEFNNDPYLRYGRINTGQSATLGDGFYLGKGERIIRVGGRASAQTVQNEIVPHLLEGIKMGGSNEYMRGALLAIAKIGGEENRARFDFTLNWFLDGDNGNQLMNFTAPVALGVLANPSNVEALAGIARDDALGREVYGRKVNDTMRAFAAYGLGLIGSRCQDGALRSRIVRDLVQCLEDGSTATTDLKVAAMTAMGLVPLDVVENDMVCLCGTCVVPDPDSSLGSQVTYLLRYFTADRDFDPIVRAHTATTLGRLIHAQPDASPRLKEVVVEFHIESLQKRRRQPVEVKQSAVLALGLVGDADDDSIDGWVRWALERSASRGGPMERRFALMSLAQVGSRRGQGEEPFAGTPQVRKSLLHHLARSKKDLKPWAGLSLGVLGFRLADQGGTPDPGVDHALRQAIKRSKSPDTLGAYALAVGMRADEDAADQLLSNLDRVRDEAARSYTALGLGMMGAREAVEPLQKALSAADEEPLLAARAGLALGMLGDVTVVEELLATLSDAENEEVRCAVTKALGFIGDERSVSTLNELMLDSEASDDVRRSAVVALGFTADRSPLCWRAVIANGANYLAKSDTLTCSDGSGILDIE